MKVSMEHYQEFKSIFRLAVLGFSRGSDDITIREYFDEQFVEYPDSVINKDKELTLRWRVFQVGLQEYYISFNERHDLEKFHSFGYTDRHVDTAFRKIMKELKI